MILGLCTVILMLLFIMPFAAGFREFIKKEDAEPLYIDMKHSQNQRYFADSFRKILLNSMDDNECSQGITTLRLSKPEIVEIADLASIGDNGVISNILFCKDSIESGMNAVFKKEVYTQRNARIGEGNRLRALACDGDIHIAKGTKFSRWLDAEGNIRIEEMCDLGLSASCRGRLNLSHNCFFKRLYGFPIIIGDSLEHSGDVFVQEIAAVFFEAHLSDQNKAVLVEDEVIERDISKIRQYERKDCSIITVHSLFIEDFAFVRGHIKTHRSLAIGKGVTITGSIYAEGDIHIGPHSCVIGTVFSQGHVILEEGVMIGSNNRIKSVIGREGIILHSGVKVNGYIMTEETGFVN